MHFTFMYIVEAVSLKKFAHDVALVLVAPFPPTHPPASADTGTIASPVHRENS